LAEATSASAVPSANGSVQARTPALHAIIGVSIGGGLALLLLLIGVMVARMRYQGIRKRMRGKERAQNEIEKGKKKMIKWCDDEVVL
jgi:hypothetical protein